LKQERRGFISYNFESYVSAFASTKKAERAMLYGYRDVLVGLGVASMRGM